MPQIIFSDPERAEIDDLVANYSPSNHPLVGPTLGLLQQDVTDEFVAEYEDMLRAVAENSCILLDRLEHAIVDRPAGIDLHDVVNTVHEMGMERSEEILLTLAGRGDSELTTTCFMLGSRLVDEILATRRPDREPQALAS